MSHKIYLEITSKVQNSLLSKLISDNELINGTTNVFSISIKNLNDKIFPGGKLIRVVIKHGKYSSPDFITSHKVQKEDIPILQPKEKIHIYDWDADIQGIGQMWLECTIESSDKSDIIFFQTDSEFVNLGNTSWYDAYYSLDKTNLLILYELRRLRQTLNVLKKTET